MNKKALIISSVGRHYHKFKSYDIDPLLEKKYEVHFAANFSGKLDNVNDEKIITHQIPFSRKPLSKQNINAAINLYKLLKSKKFDLIHCQTPIGGLLTRLINIFLNHENLYYTAHGFHFYKGSSWISWLIYGNLEKFLSRFCKKVITINEEDYQTAKLKFKCKVEYCPGVGVSLEKFNRNTNKLIKKEEEFILTIVGELNNNKNQILAIEAMELLSNQKNIKLLIVGDGENHEYYNNYIKEKELSETIFLLGHRTDIPEILSKTDVLISTSKREGLPVNIMEGMASGIPIIASRCRGNVDLIKDGINGFITENKKDKLAEKILQLYSNEKLRKEFGEKNIELIKKYSKENVTTTIEKIFFQSM